MLKIVYIDEDGPLGSQNALSALFRSLVFFVAHSKSKECNIKRTNQRSSGCDQTQMTHKFSKFRHAYLHCLRVVLCDIS